MSEWLRGIAKKDWYIFFKCIGYMKSMSRENAMTGIIKTSTMAIPLGRV